MIRRLRRVPAGLAAIAVLTLLSCAGDRPDAARTFEVAGFMGQAHWTGTLRLRSLAYATSETLDAAFEIDLPRAAIRPFESRLTAIHVALAGERIYDREGHPHRWSNVAGSTVLTPTGLPVETFQPVVPVGKLGHPYGSPLELVATFAPGAWETGARTLRVSGRASVPLASTPEGYYRLHPEVFFEIDGGPLVPAMTLGIATGGLPLSQDLVDAARFIRHGFSALRGARPVVRVGSPRRPKAIWTLFAGRPARGTRGVVADEDRPYFALGGRARFPAPWIATPGRYDLAPECPLDFALANFTHAPPLTYPDFYVGGKGSLSATVRFPDGRQETRGPYRIAEYGEHGPRVRESLEFDLPQYGEYRVTLTGEMVDRYGWTYDAGGTYRFWIAEPLTASTSAKPGTPFAAGGAFPTKVLVSPPVPAAVVYEIRHVPRSDPSLAWTRTVRGRASRYGLFFSTDPRDAVPFDAPGEYLARLSVEYRAPDGTLFAGAQTGGGVVAGGEDQTSTHGTKLLNVAVDLKTITAQDRFVSRRQGKIGDFHRNRFDCIAYPMPFRSGDVLFVAERLESGANISAQLSLEARAPTVREAILRRFPHGVGDVFGYLYRRGGPWLLPPSARRALAGQAYPLMLPLFDAASMGDMLPLLSATREGWHPAAFPERRSVVSYYYASAIRPGLIAQSLVADSTAYAPYWSMNDTTFDEQINSGRDGDLPRDVYRFQGGTVYRDLDAGVASYAAYSSAGIVEATGRYRNRVVAPFSEPLVRVNGQDLWGMYATDPAMIVQVGESLAIAGLVVPTVATGVALTVAAPDGVTTVIEGRSGPLGAFYSPRSVYRCRVPGVHQVSVRMDAAGRAGGLVGSQAGSYAFYCVDPAAPTVMRSTLPERSRWDARGDLVVPLAFQPGLQAKRLTWSALIPGALLDEGSLPVAGDAFAYHFSPRQVHRQFPNYDWPAVAEGRPGTADSVFLVFFLDARTAEGRPVANVVRIVARGDEVFNVAPPGP